MLDKEKVKERLKEKAQIEIDRWDNLNEILTEEEKQYLNKLPYSHEFYLSGSLVRMFHASPERDNLVVINQDFLETKYKMFLPSDRTISDKIADVVIYGHIHHQYMDKIYNKTIANAGSVGNSFCLIRNPDKDSKIEEIRQAKKFSLVKADEILLWINLHNDVAEWVVLDDLDLHNTQIEQHQVKPDQTVGLTLENVKQAVKILMG